MSSPVLTTIKSLSHEGRGIATINEKITFIYNALPNEKVNIVIKRKHRRYNEAEVVELLEPAADRITPPCAHANVCGGCTIQHISEQAQIKFLQEKVAALLNQFGKVTPSLWLPPIESESLGYRRKARLGVRYVRKKEKLLVGFREKSSNYLADINSCLILDPRIGKKLLALAECISTLKNYEHIPQIEVAAGDETVALIFRHLKPLPDEDVACLIEFGKQNNFDIYLQPSNPQSIYKIWPEDNKNYLTYRLAAYDLNFRFHPIDFIQVNALANQKMIAQALKFLSPKDNEHILDLFCGLGNFSLPLAKFAKQVTGVEGCINMTQRASENAALNQINNVRFFANNLMDNDLEASWMATPYDSVLLDPPRSGAKEILPWLQKINPKKIVYIACDPATFARDAGTLVHQYGYTLSKINIINMFPHTGHVETIALFEKLK